MSNDQQTIDSSYWGERRTCSKGAKAVASE